jgi:predicted DNA binding CopG/RHH family protein
MMINNNIDNSDTEILESVENGEWTSIPNADDMKKHLMQVAAETAIADYRINISVLQRDVEVLKTKALEEGIPYQMLVTSILHKYVTGKLIEPQRSFAS